VSTTYKIALKGVRFRAKFGASRSERDLPQDVVVDVTLTLPYETMPQRDHVRDVFDYDGVARLVVEEGMARQHRLLETYTRLVLERILAETPATRVTVAVTKVRAPTTHSVDAITVELSAERR
jgi:7,8-dihydroneopterin aldolase/epimerase/oxygenase